MIPNTVLLLELNPTQSNSSKLGANISVSKATNKSTDTTPDAINEVDKKPRVAY